MATLPSFLVAVIKYLDTNNVRRDSSLSAHAVQDTVHLGAYSVHTVQVEAAGACRLCAHRIHNEKTGANASLLLGA